MTPFIVMLIAGQLSLFAGDRAPSAASCYVALAGTAARAPAGELLGAGCASDRGLTMIKQQMGVR